jgi:hypothetical protein
MLAVTFDAVNAVLSALGFIGNGRVSDWAFTTSYTFPDGQARMHRMAQFDMRVSKP